MGKEIETPVSKFLLLPYEEFCRSINDKNYLLIIRWLYLIFLKTHLKDTTLNLDRDARKGDDPISSILDLESLHHVHSIARSHYSGCTIDSSAKPTLHIFQAEDGFTSSFDYVDLSYCMSLMIKVGEVILITNLCDSGMASAASEPILKRIAGKVTPLQAREILARIAYGYLLLEERPEYLTIASEKFERRIIAGAVPSKMQLRKIVDSEFGHLFHGLVENILTACTNENVEDIKRRVQQGSLTFLLDETGNFNTSSFVKNGESTAWTQIRK